MVENRAAAVPITYRGFGSASPVARLLPSLTTMSAHNNSDDEHDEESASRRGRARGGGPGVDLVRDLLRKAQEEGASGGEAPAARSGFFSGGGHTLGGEGSAGTYVPGARAEVEDELAIRRLTFWRDGFTVEDGPLKRYDDPANADVLAAIHAGHAPPSILNMRPGQRVDVQVSKRTEDDYVPPPAKPFSGTGNRLGAPTSAPSASVARAAPASNASINPRFEVDTTQPTTSIQVRLADGTRLIARMNLTYTVDDLRGFIDAARPAGRAYTIGTTFPTCVLYPAEDTRTRTVKEAGLGGVVVVQSWA
ncbi:hypothetical protein B0H14DRAFT_3639106 [Mycena olivaceomarginata]|nr:hypothetical protein B0H14DRAFT_3639106 [Mycena olivaceomarginata]